MWLKQRYGIPAAAKFRRFTCITRNICRKVIAGECFHAHCMFAVEPCGKFLRKNGHQANWVEGKNTEQDESMWM